MRTWKETYQFITQPRLLMEMIIAAIIISIAVFFIVGSNKADFSFKTYLIGSFFTSMMAFPSYILIVYFRALERESFWERVKWIYFALFLSALVGGNVACFITIPFMEIAENYHMETLFYSNIFNFSVTFIAGTGISIFQYNTLRIMRLAEDLAKKEVDAQKLLALESKAKMESLRAKVNPHFLFNTLNSISSLVYTKPELAEEMIQKLSQLFRYSLDYKDHDVVPLSEELKIVRSYLEIEKIRLGDRLQYEIKVSETCDTIFVPPFIIQPLVENSIKYAVSKTAGKGLISIHCHHENDLVNIHVIDNGPGFNGEIPANRFGLSGIQQRLQLHYGDKGTLNITSDSGAHIILSFPSHHHPVEEVILENRYY